MKLPSSISWNNPVVIGAGVVLLAPVVIPVVAPVIGSILKPVTKAAIKGGLLAYEKVKVTTAETVEAIEDLAAEAKAEIAAANETAATEVNAEPEPEATPAPKKTAAKTNKESA